MIGGTARISSPPCSNRSYAAGASGFARGPSKAEELLVRAIASEQAVYLFSTKAPVGIRPSTPLMSRRWRVRPAIGLQKIRPQTASL